MAGIIAAGILGASLQNMAISIATERSDGTLKSLAGTPMPKSAYFVGKIVQVLAVTLLIIAILLAIGVVVYGVDLPDGQRLAHLRLGDRARARRPARCWASRSPAWRRTAARPRPWSPRSPCVLQFISGVFFQFSQVPAGCRRSPRSSR